MPFIEGLLAVWGTELRVHARAECAVTCLQSQIEAGRSGVQDHTSLDAEVKTSLGSLRPCENSKEE